MRMTMRRLLLCIAVLATRHAAEAIPGVPVAPHDGEAAALLPSSSEAEPYLLGFRAADGLVPTALTRHAAPPNREAQWRTTLRAAEGTLNAGRAYEALVELEDLFNSNYEYGRMSATGRFSLHVLLGRCLTVVGMHERAEMTLFEATTMVDRPAEAYAALASLAVARGRLLDATQLYKQWLYYEPTSREALLRLGIVLLVDHSINQGRHYLQRALAAWDLDVPNLMARLNLTSTDKNRASLGQLMHWANDLIVQAVRPPSTAHTAPPGGAEENGGRQILEQWGASDAALLGLLLDQPGTSALLTPRTEFDVGGGLWELGLFEQATAHMRSGQESFAPDTESPSPARVKADAVMAHSMHARLLFNYPSVVSGHDELAAQANALAARLAAATAGAGPPSDGTAQTLDEMDLYDAYGPVQAVGWHAAAGAFGGAAGGRGAGSVLEAVAEAMRRQSPDLDFAFNPPAGASADRPVRIGIVSGYLCDHPAGHAALALVRSVRRAGAQAVVLAYPTLTDAVSEEIAAAADARYYLPYALPEARHKIARLGLDGLVFLDCLDKATYFLGFSAMAPVQMTLPCRGIDPRLPKSQLYMQSTWFADAADPDAHPLATGLGYAWADATAAYAPRVALGATPRYEFHGHYFFSHQNVYVVACPAAAVHPSFDAALAGLLEADKNGTLVILGDAAEVSIDTPSGAGHWQRRLLDRLARAGASSSSRAQRVRLMPPLDRATRAQLYAVAAAALEPFPTRAPMAALEAIHHGAVVVALANAESGGHQSLVPGLYGAVGFEGDGGAGEATVARDADEYVRMAARLGADRERRLERKQQLLARLEAWDGGDDAWGGVVVNTARVVRLKREA